jgi:hypothetical protein
MGRIRRTIIMGNPRGFVLKKFVLIIATWAVASVLVPTGASGSRSAGSPRRGEL